MICIEISYNQNPFETVLSVVNLTTEDTKLTTKRTAFIAVSILLAWWNYPVQRYKAAQVIFNIGIAAAIFSKRGSIFCIVWV